MSPLMERLTALRRRLSLQLWSRYTSEALLAASTAACCWLVIARLFPLLGEPLLAAFLFLSAALLYAAILAWKRRPGLSETALEADARLGLRERFTSSLALSGAEGRMIEAVHRDALHHVSKLDLKNDFPWQANRALRWLVVPVILFGLGYVLLPEFDLFGQKARMLEARALQEKLALKAEKLSAAAYALKPKENTEPSEHIEAVSRELAELAKQLERQEITEKQALARVSNLSAELEKHQQELAKKGAMPKLSGDPEQSALGEAIAKDLENGKPGDAAKKLRDLQDKLRKGGLSDNEKKALAKDLEGLAKAMGGANTQLGAALAAASASLASGNLSDAEKAMAEMELSLTDMASAMEQLAKLDAALAQLGEWKQSALGPSAFCRNCGSALQPCSNGGNCLPGTCPTGYCDGHCTGGQCNGSGSNPGSGTGPGMGGPGQGAGNRVGDVPGVDATLKPSVLPGEMTQGKLLADIMQKTLPEAGEESKVEFVEGAFVAVQRDAENALTKEEIPPGAKEFVRQYFGAIAPEKEADAQ